jgi:hypothetical protein
MTFRNLVLGHVGLVVASFAAVSAVPPEQSIETSVSVPAAELQFYKTREGLNFANAWGNPATGPHSNFIKIPGGSASPPHTHTASYYGVVIAGTVTNERMGSVTARSLSAGSYWYQRGGEAHVTSCISPTECLIFVTSNGPFDFNPLKSGQ